MKAICSTFSINMLDPNISHNLSFTPISLEEAKSFCSSTEESVANFINPRHESTVALAGLLTGTRCTGGFLTYDEGDTVLVMLPPRDFMSRDGEEIEVTDLETCQFWLVS